MKIFIYNKSYIAHEQLSFNAMKGQKKNYIQFFVTNILKIDNVQFNFHVTFFICLVLVPQYPCIFTFGLNLKQNLMLTHLKVKLNELTLLFAYSQFFSVMI